MLGIIFLVCLLYVVGYSTEDFLYRKVKTLTSSGYSVDVLLQEVSELDGHAYGREGSRLLACSAATLRYNPRVLVIIPVWYVLVKSARLAISNEVLPDGVLG